MHQQERAGAVGVLRQPLAAAALAEERRLLVAGEPRDREREAEVRRRRVSPDHAGRRHHGRQQLARHAEELEQLGVPVAGAQVVEQRARGVGVVGDVDPAAGEPAPPASSRPCPPPARPARRGAGGPGRAAATPAWSRRSRDRPPGRCARGASAPTPLSRSSRQRSLVRRSCQTIAGATGASVRRSHSTTVSRWLVMPSPTGRSPAAASASRMASSETRKISSGSCSTQPGSGKCWVNSRYPRPSTLPSWWMTSAVEPVVPWSSARIGRASVA